MTDMTRPPSPVASLTTREDAAALLARDLAALGIDAATALAGVAADARPSVLDVLAVYARVARELDDPWLGLRLGARRGLAWLGPLAPALRSALDVRQALVLGARYIELLVHGQTLTLDLAGPTCTLRLDLAPGPDPLGARIVQQSSVLVIANVLDELLGRPDLPRALGFACEPPRAAHLAEIARPGRVFVFDAPAWTLSLPATCLRLPLRPAPSPGLAALLRDLEVERERLHAGRDLRDRLGFVLLTRLSEGPSLATAARALGLAPRTLQARLDALGTTYQAELDRVRLDVAARYLRATDEPIALIAARVGFAAPAAFTRFFRAATGASPRAYRHSGQVPPGMSSES